MANAYTPPEAINAEKRRMGRKLTVAGAVLAGFGVTRHRPRRPSSRSCGSAFSAARSAALRWLALFVGVGLFVYGLPPDQVGARDRSL